MNVQKGRYNEPSADGRDIYNMEIRAEEHIRQMKEKEKEQQARGSGYDAVVFDMDGVIFDSERKVMECWMEVAEKYGISGIDQVFYNCLGTNALLTRQIMLNKYGEDFPYDAFRKDASEIFHERYGAGKLPKKKGIHEILEYLKDQKKKIALASSTRRAVVLQELEDGGLLSYFDQVICGDMVERSKPAPDIFLKACEALGVEPARAYVIEDSYNGIRAAHSAGMRAIMVPDMAEPTDEMERLAVVILPSLLEVISFLS